MPMLPPIPPRKTNILAFLTRGALRTALLPIPSRKTNFFLAFLTRGSRRVAASPDGAERSCSAMAASYRVAAAVAPGIVMISCRG
eukprot:scaffold35794_cov101-Isochrysis_galbana.AAC.2